MKALEKDRNRRYETANALAVDVECYLRDEPVQASSPSLNYQLRKCLHRNKVVLAFVGPLAAGVVALVASNLLIKRERDSKTAALASATAETAKANEVAKDAEVTTLTKEREQMLSTEGDGR
jgi:eukaryotic-like serine/threonine-protein kinase